MRRKSDLDGALLEDAPHGNLTIESVDTLIEKCISELSKEGPVKISVNDLLKLLELRKELTADQPKEITVKWVEPELPKSNG